MTARLPRGRHRAAADPVRRRGGRAGPTATGAIVIAPPSADASPWARRFGDHSTGFASGWMLVRGARRQRSARPRLRPLRSRRLAQPAGGHRGDRRGRGLGDARLHRSGGALAPGAGPRRAGGADPVRGRAGRAGRETEEDGSAAPMHGSAAAPLMKSFADLYTALDETTETNEKVAALIALLRSAPPADAAWAVYFLSGRRPKRLVSTGKLRRLGGRGGGHPRLAVRGELPRRRRPGRDDHPAAARQRASRATCRWRTGSRSACSPLRDEDEEAQREAMVRPGASSTGRERFVWNKLITGELPRRRLAAAGHPGPGRGERGAGGRRRPPADGRLGADPGVLRAAARARHPRRRRQPALPVLPGPPAGSGARHPRRRRPTGRRNGSGTASAPSSSAGPGRPFSGRAARSWSPAGFPSSRSRGAAPRRHRHRRRDPALARRRAAALRPAAAADRPQERWAGRSWPRCRWS